MSRRRPIVLTAAFGLALSLASAPAVQAQSFIDILRGYTNTSRHGGRLLPNTLSVQQTVDSGIANYQRELSSGVASGRLTHNEVSMLQAELGNIIVMRNQFMTDGGYSGSEADQMVAAFNRLNSLIASQLNNSNIAGGGFYGGGLPNYNAVLSLEARVRSRIDRASANGSISRAEAHALRTECNQIVSRLNRGNQYGNMNTHPAVRRLVALDRRLSNIVASRGSRWF